MGLESASGGAASVKHSEKLEAGPHRFTGHKIENLGGDWCAGRITED